MVVLVCHSSHQLDHNNQVAVGFRRSCAGVPAVDKDHLLVVHRVLRVAVVVADTHSFVVVAAGLVAVVHRLRRFRVMSHRGVAQVVVVVLTVLGVVPRHRA